MVIDNKYSIGDIVYCRTDMEQKPRIVVSISVTEKELIYVTYAGVEKHEMYEFEMSYDKDLTFV